MSGTDSEPMSGTDSEPMSGTDVVTMTGTDTSPPRAEPLVRPGSWPAYLLGLARVHWLFSLLVTAGVVLRWLVQWAYEPALIFYDSPGYLLDTSELEPVAVKLPGYGLLTHVVLGVVPDLAALPAVNHLLGLAAGALIYVVLLRRGVRPWLAALAAAPVLLDSFQLLIEQMVMSDVLLEFLVVVGIALLLWRPQPSLAAAGAAGVAFAAAGLTRSVGQTLVLAGLVFCLLVARGARRRATLAGAHVLGFALPLVLLAGYHALGQGEPAVAQQETARRLYARAAVVADCETLRPRLPAYERVLCPPPGQVKPRAGSLIEGYTFDDPVDQVEPPPGTTLVEVLNDFTWRVVRHQPTDMAAAVGETFLRPFLAWERDRRPDELPVYRWEFQDHYVRFGPETDRMLARWDEGAPSGDPEVGSALRAYQKSVGYVPGPVLFGCLLVGVAAAAGLGRARGSGLRSVCLLWVVAGGGLLLAADLYIFSWRYQLPALVTLPPAAALGLTAILRSPRQGRNPMSVVRKLRFRPAAPTATEQEATEEFRSSYRAATLGPVVVVIPAYDEAESIGGVLDALPRHTQGLAVDALVLSDGSTDGTVERAREHGAYVCDFARNVGQGTALRHGYRLAYEHGARYVVTIDADGQYDAADIPRVLEPLVRREADFVIGSRRLGREETSDAVRNIGVRVFGRLVTLLTGCRLTDTSSGLRAFTAEVGVAVTLTQPQYQTSELLIGALARGYRVTERPSVMRERVAGESRKGRNWIYGIRYALVILGTWVREWPGRRKRGRLSPGNATVAVDKDAR